MKLRKKITTTVQVLTHLKEKLQFVQAENSEQRSNLRTVEAHAAQVGHLREEIVIAALAVGRKSKFRNVSFIRQHSSIICVSLKLVVRAADRLSS